MVSQVALRQHAQLKGRDLDLTPSQTGGGFAQIYMLYRAGVSVGTALTISLLSFLGTLVGLLGMGLYSIFVGRAGESAGALFSVAVWSVTISVGGFVPKPFTPFQWFGQNTVPELYRKIGLLRDALKGRRGIQLKWHDPKATRIEGLLSRGDRRLGPVIERVWRRGGVFQEWSEHFDETSVHLVRKIRGVGGESGEVANGCNTRKTLGFDLDFRQDFTQLGGAVRRSQ